MNHVILCSNKIICKNPVDKTDQGRAPPSMQHAFVWCPSSARRCVLGAKEALGRERNRAPASWRVESYRWQRWGQ